MRPGALIAQRYRLERLLGAGGMGEVWAATHTVTGKAVALKFLRPRGDDAGLQKDARRRVLREARAACAVSHPSVVAIHDVVESDDGLPVLVMDLLRGEPLRARIERDRTLPPAEALRIAEVVLGALEVAHEAGVVHRDLKPDNLFLLEGGEVKLLDFGVAKLLLPDGVARTSGDLTTTGAMIGTPYYMAPEQAFGEAVDGRADLWAVGVVLFECLAGETPTRGDNLGQVLKLLSTGRIESLAKRAPDLPPAVAAFVDRLLRVDPAERPQSARAALEMLALARAGNAPEPVVSRRAQTRIRTAAVAFLGVAIAIAGAFVGFARPKPPTEATPSSSQAQAPAPAATSLDDAPVESAAPSNTAIPSASASQALREATLGPSARPAPLVASAAPKRLPAPRASASAQPGTKLLTDVPF
jgi:serine/threonine-protein kinase